MFLTLFFIFLVLGVLSYVRTLWVIKSEPGYVPLHPTSRGARVLRRHAQRRRTITDVFARRYEDTGGEEAEIGYTMPDQNPDSPGLETFYSKDVFVCEGDGRPKWCHDCGQWKPDRASHSREIDRCVRKMDHFCPWVGGMVAENCKTPSSPLILPSFHDQILSANTTNPLPTAFKFFFQFTFYAFLFCIICLSASAYSLSELVQAKVTLDGHLFAIIFLSGFLGMFSAGMSGAAARFVLRNMTNIDLLKRRMSYQLAVRVPLGTLSTERFMTITYPLPRMSANGNVAPEPAGRDALARRTFAILRTEPGENPWDLGWRRNWVEVMGHSPLDWLLPIKRSPCSRHECAESEYPFGPLVAELKVRYGLDPKPWTDKDEGIEMRERER